MIKKLAIKMSLMAKPTEFKRANDATEQCKLLIKKIINDKQLFSKYNIFIIQLADYYTRHKYLTQVQEGALKRCLNG